MKRWDTSYGTIAARAREIAKDWRYAMLKRDDKKRETESEIAEQLTREGFGSNRPRRKIYPNEVRILLVRGSAKSGRPRKTETTKPEETT